MRKGEVWWAELPPQRSSEPAKLRPVLVIQGDSFNRSAISTVICAVLSSNTKLADAPANLLLEKRDSGLEKSSVINFSQIITLDKSFFTKFVSMLPKSMLIKANKSIKLVLDID
ncbi:type II toxin-antitoxin system PemK/MazF family toxin [Treponema sp.]